MRTLYTADFVLPMDAGHSVTPDGALLIDGSKIVAVGPAADLEPPPRPAQAPRSGPPSKPRKQASITCWIVENFLDMAHFPFVHPGVLGSEPWTEVADYEAEIRRDVDEMWATNCKFYQPRVAVAESEGAYAALTYRVPFPFQVMLYRVCPTAPNDWTRSCSPCTSWTSSCAVHSRWSTWSTTTRRTTRC